MVKNMLALAAIVAGAFAAASLPQSAVAQPAGTTCPAVTDSSDRDNGTRFAPGVQQIANLGGANCITGGSFLPSYDGTGVVFPDTLAILNNVNNADNGFTAGISVAAGANVTNILRDGAPYTAGTQIPLTTAGAFTGTFRFDFGGNTFEFTLNKPAGSNDMQGFTIQAFVPPPPVVVVPPPTTPVAAGTGTITINTSAAGGDGTFGFTGGLGAFAIATAGGAGQRVFTSLTAGTYAITQGQLDGWALTGLQCTDPDNGTSVSTGTLAVTVDLDAGENVVCTFTNSNVRGETRDRIRQFLHRRADLLLESDPVRDRGMNRLSDADGSPSNVARFAAGRSAPFDFFSSGEDGPRDMTFSTSLSQVARSLSEADERKLREATGHALALGYDSGPTLTDTWQGRVDVWVEGRYVSFDDASNATRRSGYLGVFYAGADMLVTPDLLVGVLAQYDTTDDDATALGARTTGDGWMAGPYMTARLAENLFLDLRGAWGQSYNDIELTGLTKDSFDTTRWLVSARLTGNLRHGGFRVSPTASIKYIEEDQESFTNALGIFIPGQSVTLGRASFGAEFGYRHERDDGIVVEPHVLIEALWDFDDAGPLANTIAGTVVDTFNPLHATKVEGGVLIRHPNGLAYRVASSYYDRRGKIEGGVFYTGEGGVSVHLMSSYDGIGDGDFDATTTRVLVNVPFN